MTTPIKRPPPSMRRAIAASDALAASLAREQALRDALTKCQTQITVDQYEWKFLADSGDAGFWKAEEQPRWATAVAALDAARKALDQP